MEQIGKFPGSGGVPGGVAAFKSAASIMRIACTVPLEKFRDTRQNTPNMPHFEVPQHKNA